MFYLEQTFHTIGFPGVKHQHNPDTRYIQLLLLSQIITSVNVSV